MRMGMEQALCKQQDRGMLRGGKAEDRGMENKNFAVLVPAQEKIRNLILLCLFEFFCLFLKIFPLFLFFLFPSEKKIECICQEGRKWRKKVEDGKRSQAREPRYMEESLGVDAKVAESKRSLF